MITPTHLTFSQTFYLASCILWTSPVTSTGVFIAALASLIPDLDTHVSLPGRIVPHFSEWIHQHFGHRSITHAFVPQVIVWFIMYVFVINNYMDVNVAIAVAAGWFSHSCADMLTKTGIYFWYPSRRYRCVAWKNPRFRVEVMSYGEWWWSCTMFVIAIPLFFGAKTEQGAGGIIRYALGDIQLAVQEYQRYKGSHEWFLEIEGSNNDSQRRVDGEYYVIDVKNSNTFFISNSNNETVTVSDASTEDWFVSFAILKKGKSEATTVVHLKKDEVTYQEFIKAFELFSDYKLFITGKLAVENTIGNIEHHNIDLITLSNLPEGERYHALDLKFVFRHLPGIKLPELEIKSDPPKQQNNEILDKWIGEVLRDESLEDEF